MPRRFDVKEYLGERLRIAHEAHNRKGDREIVCECPDCGKPDKLWVNVRTGRWICFYCEEGGGLKRLVMNLDGVTAREARRIIRAGDRAIDRPVEDTLAAGPDRPEEEEDDEPPASPLPSGFEPVYDPEARAWTVPAYLRDRGIRARVAARYGLGIVTAWDCTDPECEEVRDLGRSCRYRGRLILPAHVFGEVRTFQARTMSPVGRPKYLGPPAPKKAILWGLDEAIGAEEAVVVEGPFDVLATAQKTGAAVVGLMGKVVSPGQAALLKAAGFECAVVLLDPEAGVEAVEVARDLDDALPTRIAFLPPGPDPGEAAADVLLAVLAAARPPRLQDLATARESRKR